MLQENLAASWTTSITAPVETPQDGACASPTLPTHHIQGKLQHPKPNNLLSLNQQ